MGLGEWHNSIFVKLGHLVCASRDFSTRSCCRHDMEWPDAPLWDIQELLCSTSFQPRSGVCQVSLGPLCAEAAGAPEARATA